jgi:hypothetical protein
MWKVRKDRIDIYIRQKYRGVEGNTYEATVKWRL